jgi:alkaline phosphatase D
VTGVSQDARTSPPTTVSTAAVHHPRRHNFVPEPNNVAAVGAVTIYRSLRFGKHVELIVTDERSVPQRPRHPRGVRRPSTRCSSTRRNVLPDRQRPGDHGRRHDRQRRQPACDRASAASPTRASEQPARDHARRRPEGVVEGVHEAVDATWKVWGNEVPLMRFAIKKATVNGLIVDRIMDGDAWDGYLTERNELMAYLRAQAIANVAVLSGDIHAHFAGVVMDDYTAAAPAPVAIELAAAGISSNSVFSFYEGAARGSGVPADVRSIVTYDASASGGSRFVENLNLLLRQGTAAARTMATTNNLTQALADADPTVMAHLKYADTNAQGYGVAVITAGQIEATLTTVARPIGDTAAVKRTAKFVVPAGNPGGLTGPTLTGVKPFPLT